MARCIRMRQVLSAVILFSAVLKCMFVEDGQGMSRKDADPLGTMATDATDSVPFPGRVLLEDPSFLLDLAGMMGPCHHQRDKVDLKKQLEVLKKHVIDGDSPAVKSLLDGWSAHDTYVHNLNNLSAAKDQDYAQIQCSDLDYLARHHVSYAESVYDPLSQANYKHVSYMTMLELALHMTKAANQRALTMALHNNEVDVGNQGERSEDRIRIIRFLLEKGFLWGSGDLVCKVVRPESGYHAEVRQAFARTILHDLVRDPVHMNRNRINYLQQQCGPNDMDGVVWILGSAPGAFTLLGALSHQTVLMKAAQDDTNHDEAFINFPELIDLHKVLHVPVTTMDLDGWNAEMHAARVLKEEHVQLLKETTLEMWQQQARDAFSIFFLGESASDTLSGVCIFFALNVNTLAYLGAGFFMCCLLLHGSLICCNNLCRGALDCMLSCIGVLKKCKVSFLCAEMLLRVLWLLTLNTAFLTFPPELIIAWETHTNPFQIPSPIPSVSKWNPLPLMVQLICYFCILVVVIFGLIDYRDVREKARKSMADESPPDPAFPEDRYQDPHSHFIGCVCIFGLISLLMTIYLNIVMKPLEMNPKRMALWLGSVLVQVKITLDDTLPPQDQREVQYAFDDQGYQEGESLLEGASHESSVGTRKAYRYQALWHMMHHWYRWSFCMVTRHNPDMWHLLMYAHKRNPEEMRIRNEDGPAEFQWSWMEINSRFLMSYISNGLYKAIIVYTLPLWLSRGGLTDFVLNAFATVYIVDLDDVTSGETWNLMSKREYSKFRTEKAKEVKEGEGAKGFTDGWHRGWHPSSEASTAATAAAAEAGATA